jgi:hypothetical protein
MSMVEKVWLAVLVICLAASVGVVWAARHAWSWIMM